MSPIVSAVVLALWLGILTSLSPCPLASNIAAVSWIGMRGKGTRIVLYSGLLYSAGRAFAYLCLGALISAGLLSLLSLSMPLQKYGSLAIGPLLIIVGMFALDLIPIRIPSANLAQRAAERAGGTGPWTASLLGFLLAFSFCPVSGALFFGSLIPLTVSSRSPLLLPAVFGVGSALPVFALSLALWAGGQALSRRFSRMTKAGSVAKRTTGITFIGAGMYYSLKYIFYILP